MAPVQGFCCLMQLSTRQEDFLVDVLALRAHIGPVLAPVFANPQVPHSSLDIPSVSVGHACKRCGRLRFSTHA